jgi:hypothetical protein
MPIYRDLSSNHIWIPVESRLPEVVVKNHHRVAIENLAFAPQKKPSYRRVHSKRIEEITADIGCNDAFRLNRTAFTRLKMAVLAPMPIANVSTAVTANPGVRLS